MYTNKHWPVGGSIDAGFAVPTGGRIEEHMQLEEGSH